MIVEALDVALVHYFDVLGKPRFAEVGDFQRELVYIRSRVSGSSKITGDVIPEKIMRGSVRLLAFKIKSLKKYFFRGQVIDGIVAEIGYVKNKIFLLIRLSREKKVVD